MRVRHWVQLFTRKLPWRSHKLGLSKALSTNPTCVHERGVRWLALQRLSITARGSWGSCERVMRKIPGKQGSGRKRMHGNGLDAFDLHWLVDESGSRGHCVHFLNSILLCVLWGLRTLNIYRWRPQELIWRVHWPLWKADFKVMDANLCTTSC